MRWFRRTRSHEAWELADWQPDEWECEEDAEVAAGLFLSGDVTGG